MMQTNGRPLVTVCIPTFNSERYLRECLDSVVSQTYPNIEIIVGDDGSTDATANILEEYVERHGINFHRNPMNMGPAATSSVLVGLATGKYVAVYHSDDVYERSIVQESVDFLEKNGAAGMVGTMAKIIDAEGHETGAFKLHDDLRKRNKDVYSFDELMFGVLKNSGMDIMIVTPSVMARTDMYRQLGSYNERYKANYDYEMWLRIASKYSVGVIDKQLMRYRIHQSQVSEQGIRKNVELQSIVIMLREYRRFIQDGELRRYCDAMVDKWIFRTSKKQNYRGLFQKSTETLALIESPRYLLLKVILRTLNKMKVSLKASRTKKCA